MPDDPTPRREFLKRSEVVAWLTHETIGLSAALVRTMMEEEAIAGIKFPCATYKHYSRTQIERDVLRKPNVREGSAPGATAGGKTL